MGLKEWLEMVGRDYRQYGEWTDDNRNMAVFVKQEAIYIGVIVSVLFAIITYGLDLFFLLLAKFGLVFGYGWTLVAKIVLLLCLGAIYLNHIQYDKWKTSQTKSPQRSN